MARRSSNPQTGVTWDTVALPIQAGADLRSNTRALPTARLARLLNGSFEERNSVVKRAGHRGSRVVAAGESRYNWPTVAGEQWVYGFGRYTLEGDPTVAAVWRPTQDQILDVIARENQLVAWTGDRLFAYDAGKDKWWGYSSYWDLDSDGLAGPVWGQPGAETAPPSKGVPLIAPAGPVVDVPQQADQVTYQHSCAVGRTHRLLCWTADVEAGGPVGLWARIEDLSGTVVLEDSPIVGGLDSDGNEYTVTGALGLGNIRAFWLNNYLCVLAENLTDESLIFFRIPEQDTAGLWLVEEIATGAVDLEGCWDTAKVSDTLAVVVYRDDTDMRMSYFTVSGGVDQPAAAGTILFAPGGATVVEDITGTLGIDVAHTGDIGVVWQASIGPVYCMIVKPHGEYHTGSKDNFLTAANNATRITVAALAVRGPTLPRFVGYVETDDTPVFVMVGEFNESGFNVDRYEARYNQHIAGRAFGVGDEAFVTLITDEVGTATEASGSPVKQACYVLQAGVISPRVAGAWARSTAVTFVNVVEGGPQQMPRSADFAPDQPQMGRTKWVLSFSHQPRYLAGAEIHWFTREATQWTLAETRGLYAELDFLPKLTYAQFGRSTYFSGAQPHVWDGRVVHEAGFLQWPEHTVVPTESTEPTASWDLDTGSFPATDAYRYRVYFCRRNRYGEISRSPAITSRAVTVDDATTKVTLTVSTLDATEDGDVYYEVYRNLNGGTVYHLISGFDVTTATKNDRAAATVTIVDTMPDSEASQLPTDPHNPDPGFPVELEEVALPGCQTLALANDRLWCSGGLVPPGKAFYSKRQEPGEQAAWNDLSVLEYDLDVGTDTITSIGDVRGSIIMFQRSGVFELVGDGPDNLGQGAYSPARRLSADLGATTHRGVTKTPDGLAFWSEQGPRVVTEGGSVAVLGDEVTPASTGREAVACITVPASSQVRWYLDNGNALVYDYTTRFWAEHTGLSALSAVVWGSYAALARQDGKVLFEDPDVRSDDGRAYEFRFKTAELRPKDLMQGCNRIRRWAVTGQWRGPHSLRTKIFYDGSPLVGEDTTWSVSGDLDNTGWGLGAGTFGTASSLWPSASSSSSDGVYRTRRRLTRQRCSSVSFEFSDQACPGDSFVITELALELGTKEGLARLPSRSFT